MSFLAPAWLWLLLGLPLIAWLRPPATRPSLAALRMLALAAVVAALARPALWTADARERHVFVLDRSPSVAPDQVERAGAAIAAARAALPEDAVASVIEVTAGSSLSTALDQAARLVPAGCRGAVELLTDALATDRRHGDALLALEERGIPVHVVPLAAVPRPARLAAIEVPRPLVAGQGGEVRVVVAGASPGVAPTLRGPDGELAVAAAADGGFVATFEPAAPGFVALEARLGGQVLRRTVAVQDPPRALYLGDRVNGGAAALATLVGPGVKVEGWQPSDAAELPSLDGFDLVVLDDLPAAALGASRMQAIADAVRDRGLGLFACGGAAAFGPGGYHDSPLADVLPVASIQKEEKRDPSTTLVLIIDTSGSMGGERIQLAKEVARLAMARLLPHDKVGIVEFYGAKRWAAPIQPASNSIDLARALNRMDAGGGTVILPAIEEAYYGMQNVQTRYKHVLVLTDGGVENGAFEPLLRRMADEGIAVSTVLIGPEANSEFLVDLANWGKGRFYAVPDRFSLPEILLKQPTSSRLPAYKPGTFPLIAHGGQGPRGWWGDVDPGSVPPVAGFVETELRPGALALLEIEGERAPLLATWRHGLGAATAMTTEPAGPGTKPWEPWSGYGPLLARVLARTAGDSRDAFRFELRRRGFELELRATRARPGASAPAATFTAGEGPAAPVAFEARTPDVFAATFLADPDDEVRALASADGAPAARTIRLVSPPREDERDEEAVGEPLDLDRIAAATGGLRIDLAALGRAALPAGGGEGSRRLRELTPLLLGLALALQLIEVWMRRTGAAT